MMPAFSIYTVLMITNNPKRRLQLYCHESLKKLLVDYYDFLPGVVCVHLS